MKNERRPGLRHPAGFTLVEVLATMAVMLIGLSGIVALVMGSYKAAATTSDRNIATIILPQAIAEIERNHLVTPGMFAAPGSSIPKEDVGLLIETLANPGNDDPSSTAHTANVFQDAYARSSAMGSRMNFCATGPTYYDPTKPPPPETNHTLMWPIGIEPAYFGGPLRVTPGYADPTGIAYRVLYRLERHPDWHPHQENANFSITYGNEKYLSPYVGVYILTLTVYRDVQHNATRLEQVSDPCIVYLRDKKVR